MYLDYWRLRDKPFEVTPDTRFYCASPGHEEALTRLLFVCQERSGSMVLTGDYGCGKTLLGRVLLRELARDARTQLALILNLHLSALEFLQTILFELSGPKEGPREGTSKVTLLNSIHQILIHNTQSDRDTILIVDEAQSITDDEVMEEIRMLTNLISIFNLWPLASNC